MLLGMKNCNKKALRPISLAGVGGSAVEVRYARYPTGISLTRSHATVKG